MQNLNDWLTMEQAGDYLGCSASALSSWITNGKYEIPHEVKGNIRLFNIASLDAFKEQREKERESKQNRFRYGHAGHEALSALAFLRVEHSQVIDSILTMPIHPDAKSCLTETRNAINTVLKAFRIE